MQLEPLPLATVLLPFHKFIAILIGQFSVDQSCMTHLQENLIASSQIKYLPSIFFNKEASNEPHAKHLHREPTFVLWVLNLEARFFSIEI